MTILTRKELATYRNGRTMTTVPLAKALCHANILIFKSDPTILEVLWVRISLFAIREVLVMKEAL
jgi:hypothetical protein